MNPMRPWCTDGVGCADNLNDRPVTFRASESGNTYTVSHRTVIIAYPTWPAKSAQLTFGCERHALLYAEHHGQYVR